MYPYLPQRLDLTNDHRYLFIVFELNLNTIGYAYMGSKKNKIFLNKCYCVEFKCRKSKKYCFWSLN